MSKGNPREKIALMLFEVKKMAEKEGFEPSIGLYSL